MVLKMKTKKEMERKILTLTKELEGKKGSRANRIRGEIQTLNWVMG